MFDCGDIRVISNKQMDSILIRIGILVSTITLFNCQSKNLTNVSLTRPIGVIVKSSVFHLGHNDGSEIIFDGNSGIIDIVWNESEITHKIEYWNKLFYQDLYMHFIIQEKQYNEFKNVLGMEGNFMDHHPIGPKNWPSKLDDFTYQGLFKELNLQFVAYNNFNFPDSTHYFVKINENFWNIKKLTGLNVLADILEQEIYPYEQLYSNYDEALENGIILMPIACANHDSENLYYFSQKVKKQLELESDSTRSSLLKYGIDFDFTMPYFNFNMLTHKQLERMDQYHMAKNNQKEMLQFYKELYKILEEKPFEIVSLEK